MPGKKIKSKKTQEKIPVFHQRITFGFLALSLLLVILIFYFSFSQVKIYITPQTTNLKTEFSVQILPDTKEILAGTNIMPGKINKIIKKYEKTFPVPEGSAAKGISHGKVKIINNYSKNQPLIKTTRLLTPDGKLFRLNKTVTVPAGGMIEVEVYADQPGPEYDIEPTRFIIPGLWEGLQDKIYAKSSEKFSGGWQYKKLVTEELLKKSADNFIKEVKKQIDSEIKSKEDYLLVYKITNTTWNSNIKAGQEADKFTITLELDITTVKFKEKDLQNIALNNLIAKTPANQQFINADFSTLKYKLTEIKNDSADLRVSLTGKSAVRLKKGDLDINKLRGKNKEELKSYLTSLPEISQVKIIFNPPWMNKVPPVKDHIYIEIIK